MIETTKNPIRIYLVCMTLFWLVFGLITTFAPSLMDMFHSDAGLNAKTAFSNHVWSHDGLDIIAFCIILFALSRENISRNVLLAVSFAALMPALGIANGLVNTPYWNHLFIGAGLSCFAFFIWGIWLSSRYNTLKSVVS